MAKVRVLIVDDSAVVRNILSEELAKDPNIEVVGTAMDPFVAREKIVSLKPDVLTLDVEMPRMDGITFLERLMQYHPMPVIIFSSLTPAGCATALRAMELGAIEVMQKPERDLSYKLHEAMLQLREKIVAAARAKCQFVTKPLIARPVIKKSAPTGAMIRTTDKVVAIGASTGGTEAIREILPSLPADFPGVVIAQHMPAKFTKSFADHLNELCHIEVREAKDNDTVHPGLALIAPGNFHMLFRRSGARYYVQVKDGPLVHHQRPAVDVLFESVAQYGGANALGVILTGMGADGAKGLLKMKEAGAHTISQDEKSCIVYGMPKVAFEMGASCAVMALKDIAADLVRRVNSG